LLRDIVERVVAPEPDLQVVGAVEGLDTLAGEVERTDADVVILGLRDERLLGSLDALLYAHARLRILAVTGEGRTALLYELRPHRMPIGAVPAAAPERASVSWKELLHAIRTPAGAGAGPC
jgi:hypothetical protein